MYMYFQRYMFAHEREYEYEFVVTDDMFADEFIYKVDDKQVIKALNELMELIEDVVPHIDENKYLKGCNNLKILNDLRYEKKNLVQDTRRHQLHYFFPTYSRLNVIFFTFAALWVICFTITFYLFCFIPSNIF